jgi:hypothetical protein
VRSEHFEDEDETEDDDVPSQPPAQGDFNSRNQAKRNKTLKIRL